MENDYPELSGDFALRGAAPNQQLCAPDGDGAALDGSNGNVLQNSQVGGEVINHYGAGLKIIIGHRG